MRTALQVPSQEHIETRGNYDVEKSSDGKSAVDGDEWFKKISESLLGGPGDKPGTQLHYITGIDERLCQRYAAGHVRPPGYFIRTLLRGDTGWTWLNALMDGAQPRWWVELHIDLRKARLYDQAQRIFADLH